VGLGNEGQNEVIGNSGIRVIIVKSPYDVITNFGYIYSCGDSGVSTFGVFFEKVAGSLRRFILLLFHFFLN
jgi:hypothetical protein